VTAQDQVKKLEALLARVSERRGLPRPEVAVDGIGHAQPLAHSAVAAPSPAEHHELRSEPPESARRPPVEPEVVPPSQPVSAVSLTRTGPPPPEDVGTVEVEVEEGMAEVDLEGIDDVEGASLSDSVADLDSVAPTDDEDLPASSRRPIQLEPKLEELAFGDGAEPPPVHPAPPESGRHLAMPIAADAEGDLSGVRSVPPSEPPPAAPVPTPRRPPSAPPPPAAVVATKLADVPLTPEVTKPVLPSASPAVFHGAAPAPKPQTFGDLLDATLEL
jgi:hypothetical protein